MIDSLMVKRARTVKTTSDFMVQECKRLWPLASDRVTGIPNGVADQWFAWRQDKRGAREKLGIPPNAYVILTVGRVVARKGLNELLEAVATLPREYPDVRLVAVGGGCGEGGAYQEMVDGTIRRHGLATRVRQIPWLPEED